MTVSGANKQTI